MGESARSVKEVVGMSSFLEVARRTGVSIVERDGALFFEGPYAGKKKPLGPLVGKTIGLLVASEFSDFQAYYLAEYLSEFGGWPEFLLVDWVTWKWTRPHVKGKGVTGMWDMSVDPIPTISPNRYGFRPLREARPEEYDALVVLGGHSADVMMTEDEVIRFLQALEERGALVGAIGDGGLTLISAGLLQGRRATGSKVVSFFLRRMKVFEDAPVVLDGNILTARDTVDTPRFVRWLCRYFDPAFSDERENILRGKRVVIVAGEDFEDVELVVPVLEFLFRGAEVCLGTFQAPVRSRPPLLGLDVVVGNFGVSVPLQEVPRGYYTVAPLGEIAPDDLDLVMVPGAFCPWNCIVAETPLDFLRRVYEAGKIVAGICHAPIALAAAGILEGKKSAGWLACKDAVPIMGGTYSFEWSAVIDGRVVTGRVPDDVPEFMDAMTLALLRSS
jgi:protease I